MTNRVLLVYDVDGWAWHGIAKSIQKNAPSDFQVSITCAKKAPNRWRLSQYDAVLWFSWTHCPLKLKSYCRRLWTVTDHHGCMYEYNPEAKWTPDIIATPARCLTKARCRLPQFSGVIAKNHVLYEFTKQLNDHTVYLPSGVDTELWQPAPISMQGPLRVAWCGQDRPSNPWQNSKGIMQVLRPLQERLKAHPNIVFQTNMATYRHGRKSAAEMVQWYQASDLFLCTSSSEGAPLPVFEAAACGRPVVSTSVGAVPDLVTNGETGYLLGTFANEEEASQVVDLAEQHLVELSEKRELLAEMSANIRLKIEASFCWKKLTQDWLEALMIAPAIEPRTLKSLLHPWKLIQAPPKAA